MTAGPATDDSTANSPAVNAPVTARRLLVRGWLTWVPVVFANAAVQAATTAPFVTPAGSVVFVALAVVSFLALVASLVLVVAQFAASAAGARWRSPSLRLWIAGAVAVLVIGVAAVVLAPLLLLTTTAALIMLPAIAAGAGTFSGFRLFATSPLRAIGLTICTILLIVLLWVVALLSGFFVTGALSAGLTWLVLGLAGVLLVAGWTALTCRSVSLLQSARQQ